MEAGRHERFEQLYWAHHKDLLAFIRRRATADVAEDLLAETYVVAWRRLDDIPTEERAWLFGVARNLIRNQLRTENREQAIAVRIAQNTPEGDEGIEAAIATRAELSAGWKALTPSEQEVLSLVAWEGLSNTEAARVVGISASTFAVRLLRARRRLMHVIERGQDR